MRLRDTGEPSDCHLKAIWSWLPMFHVRVIRAEDRVAEHAKELSVLLGLQLELTLARTCGQCYWNVVFVQMVDQFLCTCKTNNQEKIKIV